MNKFGCKPVDGLNALDGLLQRLAALEADNNLLKQHIQALHHALGNLTISPEGMREIARLVKQDIAMTLVPMPVQLAVVEEPPVQEAVPAEEEAAQPV